MTLFGLWMAGGAWWRCLVRDDQMVDIHWVSENFRDERN